MLGVDLAHWPWPIGWAWQNGVLGNLVASAVCLVAAGVWGYVKVWKPHLRPHIHRTRGIYDRLYPEEK